MMVSGSGCLFVPRCGLQLFCGVELHCLLGLGAGLSLLSGLRQRCGVDVSSERGVQFLKREHGDSP